MPGGMSGLQIRVGQRGCLGWVRLPFSSAIGENPMMARQTDFDKRLAYA